ncbi:hypothetical protein [Deinococcus soli (ex Cha et al. 2016)]|uniref:Uncharacterized protein n=2 Tax=Deinococcus soli (ex Cha et al. 2016) TaxID=1309411 RepID=A0AAE3XCF2_9DEIO|nr:hypothetical protein [Deinococcus soli (ex Cha et al. 2016)]MDR6218354.1 hypothetical protein [Deinococcus soli (ex Cha et al. 2016)]MDR6329094.1 hypothetical protein [Deinococcus soli (ex Cha et al. 2016)]MDR6751367.1 hypothetical protein [Deinococcus soli (ex Cha et al. 2016)]
MTVPRTFQACLVLAQRPQGVEVLAFALAPGERLRSTVQRHMRERGLQLQSFDVVRQVSAATAETAELETRKLIAWFGEPDNRTQVLARYTRPQ